MLTRRTPTAAPTRGGFTLVELLAVIAIIAVLAALTIGGVTRAYTAAKRATTYGDIDSMGVALTKFKTEFGFLPPNSFTIPTSTATTPTGDMVVLKRMFPRWDTSSTADIPTRFSVANADQSTYTHPDGTALDASQCLAYFLGGPQGTGWHPAKPLAPVASSGNRKSFFEVPSGRSVSGRFLDSWKSPFMYLPSQSDGGYSTTPVTVPLSSPVETVTAYREPGSTNKFVNHGGFQIISAGPDQSFGPGGTAWAPGGTNYNGSNPNGDGADDLANFNNSKQLGTTAQ